VKVTASRDLTFENICRESVDRKGIDLAGVVDCASPAVLDDIDSLTQRGEMVPLAGGGLAYRDRLVVLPAAEMETREPGGGISHHMAFLPDAALLRAFGRLLEGRVTNLDLSSQQCHMPAAELVGLVASLEGFVVPAHAFTPHKSLYGSCARSIHEVFPDSALSHIPAIELGLSADSGLADRLSELGGFSFLSNSDAHSLPKIAREYNRLRLREVSLRGLREALERRDGACVLANHGLDPRLGKYHRTFCEECDAVTDAPPPVTRCPRCDSADVVVGVLDRIVTIADRAKPQPPDHRPPYHHQVPLQFVPGLGSVKLNTLLNRFGTEMAVLHSADEDSLASCVGRDVAVRIIQAREGRLPLRAGGGGRFGKALTKPGAEQLSLGL
jgi:uncharacterized protein (TIGR00375 family)